MTQCAVLRCESVDCGNSEIAYIHSSNSPAGGDSVEVHAFAQIANGAMNTSDYASGIV